MALAYLKFAERNTHQFQLMFRPIPDIGVTAPVELGQRIRSLFQLVEQELEKLDPDADRTSVEIGARTLWSGVHGAAALNVTNQLYTDKKNADRLIVKMLVNRFVDSWQK